MLNNSDLVSCETCGTVVHYDVLPPNSRISGNPGRHCPVCNDPMDGVAFHYHHPGMESPQAHREVKASIKTKLLAWCEKHGMALKVPAFSPEAGLPNLSLVDLSAQNQAAIEALAAQLSKSIAAKQQAVIDALTAKVDALTKAGLTPDPATAAQAAEIAAAKAAEEAAKKAA